MTDPFGKDRLIISTYVDQALTLPGGENPPREPGFVFGTVIRRGKRTWKSLPADQELLLDGLRLRGVEAMPAYAIGAMRSFIEPVVYTLAMDDSAARDTARFLRHRSLLARSQTSIHLWDLRIDRSVADVPYRFPEPTGVCVMPNENPGEICFMRGGPYGSRAMAASMEWTWERQRLIAALGCATCNQGELYRMNGQGAKGKVFSDGGPVALVPHEVPTRYTALLEVSHA